MPVIEPAICWKDMPPWWRSSITSRSASASLSLTPASSTYSNVTRRPCDSGNRRAAASSNPNDSSAVAESE